MKQDLASVDACAFARTLNACHLSGLFFTKYGRQVRDQRLRTELTAVLRNQRIYNGALLGELEHVRLALGDLLHDPVILKGPSLWGWLYEDPAARKTRDLDLLIPDVEDLRHAVNGLRELGFQGDFPAIEEAIESRDHYELPALHRHITCQISDYDDRSLSTLLDRYPSRQDFTRIGRCQYSMLIEVELHKSFFIYEDESYADLPESALTPFTLVDGVLRLTAAAQIPYIATKFALDTEAAATARPQPQSLKLVADLVTILENASVEEVKQSIHFAHLWWCQRYYGRTLATVAPLMPEIDFMDLEHEPYDLDVLITMGLAEPAASFR